ncbi:MAG: hypothetical protein H6527_00255 [Actinobacteria bacterium]|nr:hypothetical protein [Actinomycetota bacterium]
MASGRTETTLPSHKLPIDLAANAQGTAFSLKTLNGSARSVYFARRAGAGYRAIASADPGWVLGRIAAAGPWVLWVEQDHVQSNPADGFRWRLEGWNALTRERRSIAESDEPTQIAPGVSGTRAAIVYSVYNGITEQTSDFVRYEFRTGRAKVIASGLPANQIAFDGRRALTTMTESIGDHPGGEHSDVYELTNDGAKPVTHDNHSASPQLANETLLWVTRAAVMAQRGSKERPIRIYAGDINAPSLGKTFVVDVTNRSGQYAGKVWTIEPSPKAQWLAEPAGMHTFSGVVASGPWVSWVSAPRGDPMRGSVLVSERLRPS